jgi:ABC-2 type transport system permease protein
MTTQAIELPETQVVETVTPGRRFYWSVRREVWENRSIWIGPLLVAAVVIFASMIGTITLPRKMRTLPTMDPARQHAAVVRPLSMAPAPIMLASFIIGFFYCLDALYGERRDRSILFWKSLPVSDRTTVLSKMAVPMVILPSIAFALSVLAQIYMLFFSSAVLMGRGMSPGRLWSELDFFQGLLIMLYGLAVHVIWFAPIYAWLLLISAWARRGPVLWALLPPLMISAFERIVFGTTYFMHFLGARFTGAMKAAFDYQPGANNANADLERLAQLHPLRYLGSPGLWAGLFFAAIFLAAAIRLRRNHGPI